MRQSAKKPCPHTDRTELRKAQQKTALRTFGTGISALILPISVAVVLILTSGDYSILREAYLLIPTLAICIALVSLGIFFIKKGLVSICHLNSQVRDLEDPTDQRERIRVDSKRESGSDPWRSDRRSFVNSGVPRNTSGPETD